MNLTVESLLERDGFFSRVARGNSMVPLIRHGKDQVVIAKADRPYKINDAVFFKRDNDAYVLHRIVDEKDGLFVIQGDNYDYTELVRPDQILGILIGVYRGNKYIDCRKNFLYKLYSATWRRIRFIFRPLFKLRAKLKTIFSK